MNTWTNKIFGIALGNTLVLYDFILYGFLGSTIGKLFFPHQTAFVALMSVFLIYASSCLFRPLGAFVFGLIGDKYGRKSALVSSILLMSLSSVLIGCLPTYADIGEAAVVLLVLFRVLQGFSMSGEEVGSAVYLIESAPDNRKSIAGSIVLASVHFGLFFGALMVLICLLSMSTTIFNHWGWRVPFLLSLPISLIVLYFRLKQTDSTDFNGIKHNKTFAYPLKQIFREYKLKLLTGFLICSLSAICIYIYAVYIPNFLKVYQHFSIEHILIFSIISFAVSAAAVLYVGKLGDSIGIKLPIYLAATSYIILSPIAFWLLTQHALWQIIAAQALFIIIVALASGTLMFFLAALFPVEVRYTGVAICFNFSMILFGSTAPIIILALHKANIFPAFYLMLMGVVVITIFRLPWQDISRIKILHGKT